MGFSVSKLFGKKNVNKPIEDSVDAIITDIENKPFGIAKSNVLYAGLDELGGYYMFKTVVVGQCKIKTMNGAKLVLKGADFELQLNSDMPELESDPTDILHRHITKIDFQIEEKDIKHLEKSRVTSIELKAKKQDVLFTKYDDGSDEEE